MKPKILLPILAAALALALAGCTAPIGADLVSTRQAYAQVDAQCAPHGHP